MCQYRSDSGNFFYFHSTQCHSSLLGNEFEGSPITPETQLPLADNVMKDKEKNLFPYQLYFKSGLHTKQGWIIVCKQTISWSMDEPLPKSQSIAGWFWCWCLGLQSTTECSGAFGLETFPFTFTFASFGKRKQINPKCRLLLKLSLTVLLGTMRYFEVLLSILCFSR